MLEIEAKDAAPIAASVVLERAPADTGPTEPAPAQGPADDDAANAIVERPTPPAPAPISRRSAVAPIVTTAATAAAGGFALGFYIAALGSADKAGEATELTRYNELRDQARDRQHIAWGFTAAAGAAAIVSGVLWYRYASRPRIEVRASGTGAAVSFSGRW